jgi:hypothetical protein
MMSALDLLDVYRELVEHYIPVAEMSDDERYTMEQWKIRSDLLRSHPERAVGVLEWATREAYFERVQKKFIERTGKPLTYEQGKFVMSLIEIDTDDPKQNAKKARQLAGLLSNGRVLTTAEIDAAELPGEDEGLQYVRAQAVKEILTWEPHDREHVEMDWDSAIVPDHIPAPGRVEADYRDEKIVHIRVLDLNGMDATEAVTTLRNAYERRVDPASLRQDDAHQVHQISTRVDHHFGPGIEL